MQKKDRWQEMIVADRAVQEMSLGLLAQQNKLLQQQVDLLLQLQLGQLGVNVAPAEVPGQRRMMTEHDLQLILSSGNVLQSIDRWNKRV